MCIRDRSRPIGENLDDTFQGLAGDDAEPSLRELTRLAIENDIDVIPVDSPREEVYRGLDFLDAFYGPHSRNIDTSLFSDQGKAIRDMNAANAIGTYFEENNDGNIRALVIFGTDHFNRGEVEFKQTESDRKHIPPLHVLIEEESGREVIFENPDQE